MMRQTRVALIVFLFLAPLVILGRSTALAEMRVAPISDPWQNSALPAENKPPRIVWKQVQNAQPGDDAVFLQALWDSLSAPDQRTLDFFSSKFKWFDRDKVREVNENAIETLLDEAVGRRLTSLDFFSDQGLQEDRLFYIPRKVLNYIDKQYDLHSLFLLHYHTDPPIDTGFGGFPERPKDFAMEHLLLGGKRVVMFYNLDEFTFKSPNPNYQSYGGRYTFESPIVMDIQKTGDIKISDEKRYVTGPVETTIQEFSRINSDGDKCRDPLKICVMVRTTRKDQITSMEPICKKPACP